ncbi:hypothetical protein BH10PLA1_BH10PLA1_13090 [soil metagenome]
MQMSLETEKTSAGAIREHVQACLKKIEAYADPAVWISRLCAEHVEAQVARVIARQAQGIAQPLAGLTVGVKDNIDVGHVPTTAACPDFAYTPTDSAFVVQKLCDAGAIVLGKTNLDQFATGLVGVRSPYGACRNTINPEYISGGSSSGSAVAVAAGLVDFSLGTDTAGSGRVPAAFNNLIGVKPTCGLLSTRGVVPACRSLDCVSIFTRDCHLARIVLDAARGFDEQDIYSRKINDDVAGPARAANRRFTFGVPDAKDLQFFGNDAMRKLFDASVDRMTTIGGAPVAFDLQPFLATAELLYDGPWVAERMAAVGLFYREHPKSLLPVIETIIKGADKYSAVAAFEGQYRLKALQRQTEPTWQAIDVMLLPTTGTIYKIAEVQADPIALNRNLGYYTNFVNLLDLCALAVPAGVMPSGLPGGVSLIAERGHDHDLLDLGQAFVNQGTRK